MPNVLGIHCGHNAAAALFIEGKVVAAISEERLSRVKNHLGFPYRAVAECMRLGQVEMRHVTHVALSEAVFPWRFFEKPSFYIGAREGWHSLRRRLRNTCRNWLGKPPYPKERLVGLYDYERMLSRAGLEVGYPRYFLEENFKQSFEFTNAKIQFYPHHLTHAFSTYACCGWPEALVITIDGGGFGICHSVNVPQEKSLKVLRQTSELYSPGFFYQDITVLLGFKPLQHEGKITGLAAYGKPRILREALRKCLRLTPDGWSFESDFDHATKRQAHIRQTMSGHSREDVSAAAQLILEEAVVPHVRQMVQGQKLRKVALAGGVFANVKLNQHIAELPEVEEIFVTPPMGDEGLAWGAAFAMMADGKNGLRPAEPARLAHVYLGPSFSESECENSLKSAGVKYQKLPDPALFEKLGAALAEGKVVGWFQGRMEFGPRALGNRSVLAAPVDPNINGELSRRFDRSEFMPFAPSVLEEYAADIFEGFKKAAYSAEFMTVTFPVSAAWKNRIPAVVHVDGTARPQVVRREVNPRYYGVIDAYRRKTGLPVVLNTSFNVHEEPIVCHPREAVRAFLEKRVDILVLENFIAEHP